MKILEDGIKVHVEESERKYYIFSPDDKRACYTYINSPVVYLLVGENLSETYKRFTPRWIMLNNNNNLVLDWIKANVFPVGYATSVH